MIKNILVITLLLVGNVLFSQKGDPSVLFTFEIPKSHPPVEAKHLKQLADKIGLNQNGSSYYSNQSAFVLMPSIEILKELEDGQMTTTKVVKVQVGLVAKESESNLIFAEFTKVLTGSGKTTQQAITAAINTLKKNDPKVQEFIKESNANILNFFRQNCDKILQSAKVNVERKEYLRAYQMLTYVPEDLPCFKNVEKLITQIYFDFKGESCRNLVQKATLEEAKENFEGALNYLKYVDSGIPCYKTAQELIEKISSKTTSQSKANFEFEKQKFDKLTDLEKMKILATHADILNVVVTE